MKNNEKLEAFFGLPTKVQFCKKCCYSNQRPTSAQEFKHTKDTKNHPVAPEDQFKGGTKHSGKHKGYEGAPGEKNVVKAKKTFKELRGQGSSKRKADKSGGDTAMKSVKEEAEFIDENINSLIRKSKLLKRLQEITKKNKPGAVSFKDKDTMTVEPKDAKDIMEVLKKLTCFIIKNK